MPIFVTVVALAMASTGTALLLQIVALRKLGRPSLATGPLVPISVLRPMKGTDDRQRENLESLARQDYPQFEIVAGTTDVDDPAVAVAREVQRRFPEVPIRVVAGGPVRGPNPKVANLENLVRLARHEHVLVSDANVEVDPGYLRAIVRELGQPGVGLVANLIAGTGERTLGASLENLHLGTWVVAAVAGADALGGHPIVIGKSMLMRQADLERAGGLEGVRDILAEDYVLGRRFEEAGQRVVISSHVIRTVNVGWSVSQFLSRHLRWCQLRRRLRPGLYLAEPLMLPLPWLALTVGLAQGSALAGEPWLGGLTRAALAGGAAKILVDALLVRRLRGTFPGLGTLLLSPLKDALFLGVWAIALGRRTVVWRGHRLRIEAGSRVRPLGEPSAPLVPAGDGIPGTG